jgi:2-polyprenyl-6-hydroxyphenyl methylase / 3-demethylubiquinone-9 3-methyltransferase
MTHAEPLGLDIDYRNTTVEALIESQEPLFDIVLNLEVVEHFADVDHFLETAAALVNPDGIMILATINRTLKALALAKIGAEYVLRWLPAGTHDPRKFVKPEEVKAALSRAGLTVTAQTGVSYNPLMDIWRISDDTDVNYMLTAIRAETAP